MFYYRITTKSKTTRDGKTTTTTERHYREFLRHADLGTHVAALTATGSLGKKRPTIKIEPITQAAYKRGKARP